jgi:RNA polymerase sigma factor (sigma-70 family)
MNNDDLRNIFSAWMKKVVSHAKIDYLRRREASRKRESTGYLEDYPEPGYEPSFHIAPPGEFDFEEERLAESFAKLPLMRKRILTLLFVEGLSAEEIADRLNCSRDYVYKSKLRALKTLRYLLEEGGEERE